MSVYGGPSIVRDGLILLVDFANKKCYPGSGATVYDISGSNYTGTFVGSPPVANGVVTVTNGTGVDLSSVNISAYSNFTILGAARYNGLNSNYRGRMINGWNNNWLMGHWSNTVDNYYSAGWVGSSSAGGTDNNWRIYHATGNTTAANSYELFVNDSLYVSASGGTQGPNGIAIGGVGYTAEYSDGDCAFVAAYNRVLSPEEIIQNFNALRGRFGI